MITHITERETALTTKIKQLPHMLNVSSEAMNHVTAERNALQADAARYRLLRDSDWEMFKPEWLAQHDIFGEGPDQMDEELDAIIASDSKVVNSC